MNALQQHQFIHVLQYIVSAHDPVIIVQIIHVIFSEISIVINVSVRKIQQGCPHSLFDSTISSFNLIEQSLVRNEFRM